MIINDLLYVHIVLIFKRQPTIFVMGSRGTYFDGYLQMLIFKIRVFPE